MPLHSSHVVVANSLIPYLEACIASIPSSKNVRVMRDDIRIIVTTPKLFIVSGTGREECIRAGYRAWTLIGAGFLYTNKHWVLFVEHVCQ